jgi:hypothetical protein
LNLIAFWNSYLLYQILFCFDYCFKKTNKLAHGVVSGWPHLYSKL